MSADRESQELSEDEIDDLVEAQAEDDAAWEEPIEVHPDPHDHEKLIIRAALATSTLRWETNNRGRLGVPIAGAARRAAT